MCFDPDSRPPIAPISGGALDGRRLKLEAEDGNRFTAFAARAAHPSGVGMLLLPDVRGLHPYYEELALRFAEAGIDALAIDYFGRTAGTAERPADFDHMPHVGQTTWAGLRADATAGVRWLRDEAGARPIFSVGFCFGGRLSFLLATVPELDLAGVIGFYGVPTGRGRNDMPAPADVAGQFRAPVLGLFGGADQAIPPEALQEFDRTLTSAGVEHEFTAYPGAPHSFFDRKADEFAEASADAWRRVLEFVRTRSGATAQPS
jgi:carboxymethylenebutenolidase